MRNKRIVQQFYDQVFNKWDLNNLDSFMREDYIQHSPEVEDGREGFRRFIQDFIQMRPHAGILHILEDGDYVCVFFRCVLAGGKIAKVFDLYRLEGGKLAEHWDCTMDTTGVPVRNSNGHF